MQADLFADPLPGLSLRADLIDTAEEAALIERIDAEPLVPFRFGPWTGRRLVRGFGPSFDFVAGRMAEEEPLPGWLLPVRARAAAVAGLPADAFVQALLLRYDPGAGIGWHRDRPAFDRIVGVSLGQPCDLRLRRRREGGGFDRRSLPLAPRSAYCLAGEARREWEHGIAPMTATRHAITFRSLRPRA